MKNIHLLLLLLLLFTSNAYCQDISYIKTLDTIFVNFKESQSQIKTVLPVNSKGFQRWYIIYFEENKKKEYLQFWVSEYPDYVRREMNLKSDVKVVKKSYLRKNKKKIISIDFFKKYGVYRSMYEAFEKCKVIYIIDNSEINNRQITLYEVTKSSSYVIGE